MSFKHYDIAIDFDGVIHSYTSGFQGADVLPDPPVPGAIVWLENLVMTRRRKGKRLRVVIFTTRMQPEDGDGQPGFFWPHATDDAVRCYLIEHGMTEDAACRIDIALFKPSAKVYIDDRGFRFEGVFPDPDELMAMEPWNKQARKVS
jgi:hypothetical protein